MLINLGFLLNEDRGPNVFLNASLDNKALLFIIFTFHFTGNSAQLQ